MSRPGAVTIVAGLIGRDLRLALRRRADVLAILFFFVIVVSLFPLGVGPEKQTLRAIAPGGRRFPRHGSCTGAPRTPNREEAR